MKKIIGLMMALVMALSLCACGFGGEEAKLKESDLTGAQVQEEFWNSDLEASAELLMGYRAQSLEEVTRNWRQAKMQGNGAILYALYSSDLKELFLNRMNSEFGIWNFYYGKENEKPYEVTCSKVNEVDGISGMYYSTITTIGNDMITETEYDIYIELIDGGYFVTSETAPVPVQ